LLQIDAKDRAMQDRKRWGWAVAALMVAAGAQASGYKLPEQSVRAMGKAGANVAGAYWADASYYNPANMGWVDGEQALEGALTFIYLPKIDFKGTVAGYPADASSKSEDFLVPTFHYVGPRFGQWRFGLSVTAPGGLSKRWDTQPQKSTAEEFTLAIVEMSPSVSYTFNEAWAVGAGVRVLYADGTVRAYAQDARGNLLVAQNMEGDTIELGYNLALSYRPQPQTTLSVTYRSNIDMKVEGTAKGGGPLSGHAWFDTDADVTVPLPATLSIAAYHDFGRVAVELEYERAYWSEYSELDFNFDDPVVEASVLGQPRDKSWKDSDTFRVGVTWHVDEKWDMLFGYAWDESPVPERTLGFELPDADAHVFSVGSVVRIDQHWEAGFGLLYDHKESRSVDGNENEGAIDGTFDKGGAYLATVSVGYRF
jgi:long-chain fatty acid transport protein